MEVCLPLKLPNARPSHTYLTAKMEALSVEGPLTVEHILPRDWIEHWPLPDGARGLTMEELWTADANDPLAAATRARNVALQTFGNLTILTQALNSAASNSAWAAKKPELLRHSLLPITIINSCTTGTSGTRPPSLSAAICCSRAR
jgi:hypothetical protein